MSRWITTAALAGLVVGGTAACSDLLFDEADHSYDGPPLVEFAPDLPEGDYSVEVGFAADSEETETVTVTVQYVSAPPEADVTGELAEGEGTTAVEGEHYALTDDGGYTIAAGRNSADVQVELLGAGLENGQTVSLVLELTDGDGFQVSENYDRFEIIAAKEES